MLPNVRALSPRIASNGAVSYLSSLGGGDGLWCFKDNDTLEIWKGREGPPYEPAAISPDAKRVAISLRRQGKIHLNVLNDDGTGVTALAENPDVRGSPTWSPDGRWIAIGGIDAKGQGLFKVPVEGGDPVRLAMSRPLTQLDNQAAIMTFDVTPDGKKIVFDRLRENSDIVLIDFPKSTR